MRSAEDFNALVKEAHGNIDEFVNRVGLNRVYSAYSGGKDSQAVLDLVRSRFRQVLAVHNDHPGEKLDREDVLVVKQPKLETVPQFLRTVDLVGQIDGTRQDEDKTVIFDGVEIHRSKMPGPMTEKGVFDLQCLFPLWNWTEEDVFRYLNSRQGTPVKVRDVRVGYEGEGPMLGRKTLYCRYPGDLPIGTGSDTYGHGKYGSLSAMYLTVDYLTLPLMQWLFIVALPRFFVTLEVPLDQLGLESPWLRASARHENFQWFVNCNAYRQLPVQDNLYIKVETAPGELWEEKLEIANQYGVEGHQVLFMPSPVQEDGTPLTIVGSMMMDVIGKVHANVRVMPPVHKILGIP